MACIMWFRKHAFRKRWKTFRIKQCIEELPYTKKKKDSLTWIVFNAFDFYVDKILNITCAYFLRKCLIFAIIVCTKFIPLNSSMWRSLSHRNQSTDLFCKWMNWFLHDRNLCHKRVEPLNFKGALSGLRQFLATESPLKMMKNAFYFHLKSSFCYQDI